MTRIGIGLIAGLGFWSSAHGAGDPSAPGGGLRLWSDAVETRLRQAGTNGAELVKAFQAAPPDQRKGLDFLVENMPASDLETLSAPFLLANLNLAYEAWQTSPWRAAVSQEMFFNGILPYANLTEERDGSRALLRQACLPMIQGARTPGEAAQWLNRKIFPHFKVTYNTSRQRPDQSPAESIRSGIATCTGLAILLVDACRAVGVPARVAGTEMWWNMRGNHTWVEVWDGDWHFTGAAEPDAAGLDHGWFLDDAAKAQREVRQHAIWAASFQRTGDFFPLVWLPGDKSVPAVNVTDRYTVGSPPAAAQQGRAQLSVKVMNAAGRRVVADVALIDLADAGKRQAGKSRSETADLNDFVSFKVALGGRYRVEARLDGRQEKSEVAMSTADQLMTLVLPEEANLPFASCPATPDAAPPLSEKEGAALRQELDRYFSADLAGRVGWDFPARLEKLLASNESAVRRVAWSAYCSAPDHAVRKANYAVRVVRSGQHASPYTVKPVGARPANGWPIFIAMHGGGGAPKELNDSQWRHMQIYYKDHPELGGYLYLALRAPNDTWNGFYDDYVYPLIDQLILQFRVFGDIDPDKVFILGYSHGGYGAYAIGPKMPDRFAAIHASAAAATDGETTAKTLLHTPFTAMVGELDTQYDRYERNLKFRGEVEKLRGGRADIYPVTVTIVNGNGHTGLPDRDFIAEMYPAVRNPVPSELDWLMTDGVIRDFFWLRVDQPAKQSEILASCRDNRFVITANETVAGASVLMDARMVDFGRPVSIELNGSTTTRRFAPRLKTFCETLIRRGDPDYAFSAEFHVVPDPKSRRLVVAPSL